MLIGLEDAHAFLLSTFGEDEHLRQRGGRYACSYLDRSNGWRAAILADIGHASLAWPKHKPRVFCLKLDRKPFVARGPQPRVMFHHRETTRYQQLLRACYPGLGRREDKLGGFN
jgi:hypothetical protein